MNEITSERLSEIERLHNAASGGQWQAHYHAGDVNDCVEWVRKALSYQPDSTRIHMVVTGTPDSNGVCPPGTVTVCVTGNGPSSEANADFVAMAYNNMSDLCAALRQAWAERAEREKGWDEYEERGIIMPKSPYQLKGDITNPNMESSKCAANCGQSMHRRSSVIAAAGWWRVMARGGKPIYYCPRCGATLFGKGEDT